MCERDYVRFLLSLHHANNGAPLRNMERLSTDELFSFLCKASPCTDAEKLVEIHAFALMPNHYHLLLTQLAENGITKFLQRVGTSYSMYINKKYERVGPIFQGPFKSALIENEQHLLYIPHYIHLNPLDLMRDKNASADDKMRFLEKYKWSSLNSYVTGTTRFPSLAQTDRILSLFGGKEQYRKDIGHFVETPSAKFDTLLP